ncbi:VTT domain-containing protein [Klugiella xanthotipulae]|uniref:Membrane-associated protein n=1 Tax=Klugiella xanthotipulae TaxID=244735 RepID=A0A543I673_9MICO|nr:VTT domain-containing protein [Klugiella xanthotipulae]TQM66077.1 membrane-associated protein [Klugiella xanthotipulae]
MHAAGLFDPAAIIQGSGGWGLLVVCGIIFVETGLLIGFLLPGDTLLFFTGVLTFAGVIDVPLLVVVVAACLAAVAGDQLGYIIGHRLGPSVFERKQAGLISQATLERTNGFFERYGAATVMIARFVAVVRTVAPVAAGASRMHYARFLSYNVMGGVLWCVLLILAGFFLGQIPGVADFVSQYIDLVLMGIVGISVLLIVISAIRARRQARG